MHLTLYCDKEVGTKLSIEIFRCKVRSSQSCLQECVFFFAYNSAEMWYCVCNGTYVAEIEIMGTPPYHIIHSCYITLFPPYAVTT